MSDKMPQPALARLIQASADAERCKDEKLAAANEADWCQGQIAALRDAAQKAEASRAIVAAGFRCIVQLGFDRLPEAGEEEIVIPWADYQRVQDYAADISQYGDELAQYASQAVEGATDFVQAIVRMCEAAASEERARAEGFAAQVEHLMTGAGQEGTDA